MDYVDNKILSARQGYNLLANDYERWKWYPFWRANEGPLIKKWLENVYGLGLDAGCGNAPYLTDYGDLSNKHLLIDFSEGMLAKAKKRLKKYHKINPAMKSSFSIIQADIQFIPIDNNQIDFILCSRVLSNIQNFKLVFKEFSRLLKPSGSLLITDVHPLHTYEYTGIETKSGRLNIETYKHSIKDILDYAPMVNLKIVDHQEYDLLSLFKAPKEKGFEKIHASPTKPIFYTLKFEKSH